jgi:hypothetical protein
MRPKYKFVELKRLEKSGEYPTGASRIKIEL